MKVINTSGKRKTAIARATFREGKGRVRINSVPLEVYSNEIIRMKISEAIALAPGAIDNVDVDIEVSGGGVMGQAEAVRTALGRGILGWTNDPKIKEVYLSYDRTQQKSLQTHTATDFPVHAMLQSVRSARTLEQSSKTGE